MKTKPVFQKLPNGDRVYTDENSGCEFIVRPSSVTARGWQVISKQDGRAIALCGSLVQVLNTIHYQARSYYPS